MPSSLFSYKTKRSFRRDRSPDSFSSLSIMSTASISSTGSRSEGRRLDTGFPDSFTKNTTSMRHPDARADRALSAEDIDPARFLQQSRQSMIAKHKRTMSQISQISTLENQSVDDPADLARRKAELSKPIVPELPSQTEAMDPGSPDTMDTMMSIESDQDRRRSRLFKWFGSKEQL